MYNDQFKSGDVIVGRYRLVEKIGAGGFGVVYRAVQLGMERDVAVKLLHASESFDENGRERFRREGLVVRNLNHPNTIRQYDFGETENGTLFLVLEYLKGRNLVQCIRAEGALGDERVRGFVVGVLKSLAEAHSHGIVHRDLKPGNIMLCDVYGERDYPKILDFGIAKVMMGDSPDLTAVGIALGSPRYMAPEVLRGEDPTPACDVYSISITIAEAIMGQPLIKTRDSLEAARLQLDPEPLPIPEELIQSSLWPWLSIGLKKDKSERYKDAEEMLGFFSSPLQDLIDRGAERPSIATATTDVLEAVDGQHPFDGMFGDPDQRATFLGTPNSDALYSDDTNALSVEEAQRIVDEIRHGEVRRVTPNITPARPTLTQAPQLTATPDPAENRPTSVYSPVGARAPSIAYTPESEKPTIAAESIPLVAPPKLQKISIFDESPPRNHVASPDLVNPRPLPTLVAGEMTELTEKKNPDQMKKIIAIVGFLGLVFFATLIGIGAYFFINRAGPMSQDKIPTKEKTSEKKDLDPEVKKDIKKDEKKPSKLLTFDVTSSPSGATLILNKKKLGKTPLTFSLMSSKLPASFILRKKGYEDYNGSFDERFQKLEASLLPKYKKSNEKKRKKKKRKKKSSDNNVPAFD